MIDGGRIHAIFTGRTSGSHLDLVIVQLFFQNVPGFGTSLPSEMTRVADFNFVVVDP